jgi:hypothetical protein
VALAKAIGKLSFIRRRSRRRMRIELARLI